MPLCTPCPIISHSSFQKLLVSIHCSLHRTTFHSTMTGESGQISNVTDDIAASDSQSVAGMESDSASLTSSSTMADQTIAKKKVQLLHQNWKAPMVTDKDISAYHVAGWLLGVLLCSPTTLYFLTINRTNIVCFESYLMCGLGLPPSKFLVSILNYCYCFLHWQEQDGQDHVFQF
jgi:hypothetical protein